MDFDIDPYFEKVFNPSSIAVVGASESSSSRRQGARFIRIFQKLGFKGTIYPVNLKAEPVYNLKAYRQITGIPETPDLVIISVPATEVISILQDCVKANARNIHIFASGFGETGEKEGKALEQKVLQIAKSNHLNVIGPNCMGINVPSIGMQTLHPQPIPVGKVAFLSQSGGHATQFTRYAAGFGIGFSRVISYGNGLIMDSTDLLPYLYNDPETSAIALYIEGVRDGKKLTRQLREINLHKPVIIWKGGISDSGARAVASHTGSLAGKQEVWNTLFNQTGVTTVSSLDELADCLLTSLYAPPVSGKRVAMIMGGGGHAVTSADFCAREGLEVPALSDGSMKSLRQFIPLPNSSVRNPVDAENILMDVDLFYKALEIVAADPYIDMIIIDQQLDILQELGETKIEEMERALLALKREMLGNKLIATVLTTWGGDAKVSSQRNRLQTVFSNNGILVYRTLARACRALGKFADYCEFKRSFSVR